MPVSARFVPESIELVPGTPTSLSLRLHNSEAEPQVVHLSRAGDLVDYVTLDVDNAAIEPNQIFDIPVTVEVGPTLAGRQPGAERETDLRVRFGHRSARRGGTGAQRAHRRAVSTAIPGIVVGSPHVRVVNSGNVTGDGGADPDPLEARSPSTCKPTVVVAPGATEQVALLITPTTTYWNGPAQEHPFVIRDHVVGRDRHRARRHLRATSSGAALARASRRRRCRRRC